MVFAATVEHSDFECFEQQQLHQASLSLSLVLPNEYLQLTILELDTHLLSLQPGAALVLLSRSGGPTFGGFLPSCPKVGSLT